MIVIGGIIVQPAAYASKEPSKRRQLLITNTIADAKSQCYNASCKVGKHCYKCLHQSQISDAE